MNDLLSQRSPLTERHVQDLCHDGDLLVRRSPLTERHVQALWYDGDLRPAGIRTSDGLPVRVLDPGVWNLEAGPDFRDAVLEIGSDRRRVRGDVEIHVKSSDWATHGHAHDPAYAHVVAHVTWHRGTDGAACLLPAGCHSICLGDVLRTRSDFSLDEIDLTAYPHARLPSTPRPCEAIFSSRPDLALETFRAAGRQRIQTKARRFRTLLMRRQGRIQVFYEEFLAALGYKHNQQSFRALARTIPWSELPLDESAILCVLQCAAEMTVERTAPWRRANVRPANAPLRRLAAAAQLLAGGVPAFLESLAACDIASRQGQKEALAILGKSKHLGANRAAAILVNVLMPFALAEKRMDAIPDWIAPEDTSAPVRLTAGRLLGRDHNPALYGGNGLCLQGLLEIHRAFCLAVHPDCSTCALVDAARKWDRETQPRSAATRRTIAS
ncbi:MAG: DUF2851 family protein [Kiritimatiellia bacterium]